MCLHYKLFEYGMTASLGNISLILPRYVILGTREEFPSRELLARLLPQHRALYNWQLTALAVFVPQARRIIRLCPIWILQSTLHRSIFAFHCLKYNFILICYFTNRYKSEWRTGGMDKHYDSRADLFGSSGGNCLDKYKYQTYGTANECNVPWYYH